MGDTIDSSFQRLITGAINVVNGTLDISSPNQATSIIQTAGTWVGTLIVEGSNDGSAWYQITEMRNMAELAVSSITSNGLYIAPTNGFALVRMRASAWTSGAVTLSVYGSDAVSLLYTDSIIKGATDGTEIGNTGDRLKVDAGTITATATLTPSNILKQLEFAVNTKVETDATGVTYTVPPGKIFSLVSFNGSYDTMSPMYLRLKKQTGGTGAFNTLFRITLKIHGQDESDFQFVIPNGLLIGAAGDVFKVTYESALAKGTLWTGFMGIEA